MAFLFSVHPSAAPKDQSFSPVDDIPERWPPETKSLTWWSHCHIIVHTRRRSVVPSFTVQYYFPSPSWQQQRRCYLLFLRVLLARSADSNTGHSETCHSTNEEQRRRPQSGKHNSQASLIFFRAWLGLLGIPWCSLNLKTILSGSWLQKPDFILMMILS